MTSRSPIFPMPEPQHFSDYGFDPQIDYFQILEEARKHKRESRSIDALHFKLQKPISKEDSKKTKKRKWWKNALLFWRSKSREDNERQQNRNHFETSRASESCYRAISSPVYVVGESGLGTPSRSRPTSGPLAGTLTPTRNGDVDIPYLSLRELNLEHHHQRISISSMPIYLVT
ncbi:uncharacterized protein LOC131230782 [Magnolia sinica]|uniref:uncharacterized protein LOC131230782 n=1 Tax=Magnolia sinica TaxID=86752 RepID=UPI0026586F32|nr:uncharacterized protein LOC131230782 [Magnolia sinica]